MTESEWGVPAGWDTTPTSIETRIAIMDLMARYAWGFDTGNAEAVAALFTEDCEYITAKRFCRGRAEVAGIVTAVRADPSGRGKQHWSANSLFTGDGQWCFARTMGAGPRVDDGSPSVDFVGFYDDVFHRVDGEWRIKRRIWRNWADGMEFPPMNDASDLVALHSK